MTAIRRGEVWYVSLDPTVGSEQAKARPCLVAQRDAANATSPLTIVCPLTDAKDSKGSLIAPRVVKGEGGLRKDSLVLCNQIRAVSRARLVSKLGTLQTTTLRAVDRGLVAILDLQPG